MPVAGVNLRIAIVHARWNAHIIDALVSGAKKALLESGVKDKNVVIQGVPGSYELPFAVQQIYQGSKIQASKVSNTVGSAVADLLSSASLTDLTTTQPTAASQQDPPKASLSEPTAALSTPFDAIIAVGVLIKGETMHFEYIADATSHGLMRVQLDDKVPVIFGLLTVLSEEQGQARAGLIAGTHCHGEDWGRAAVELGMKRKAWTVGDFE